MKITPIDFSLVEKFAIVQAVDAVIVADGNVHDGEINALRQLMQRIDLESNFILQARNMTPEQGWRILRDMSDAKKEVLAKILDEMAISDGFVHKNETKLISTIFSFIGIPKEAQTAK